jgi:benzoyl-CoA reductase/2-hydroxyglutaryl-CoA dehydratase subunit BcrC/BadD/HgdB
MNSIAYCQPFVPPEWIAAHGLRPLWMDPQTPAGPSRRAARRGVCPVAAALLDSCAQRLPAAALVLTTTCDQMRYAASALEESGKFPVFLMHVPRTWQTAAVVELYREELQRLGRFLVRCGGQSPTADALRQVMLRYDQARAEVRGRRESLSGQGFAAAVAAVRGDLNDLGRFREKGDSPHLPERPEGCFAQMGTVPFFPASGARREGIPLALIGGPVPGSDQPLLEIIERTGGRVVLDATELGERTLPPPLDPVRLRTDPLAELVRAYFGAIPDVFRRPNDRLYAWLRHEVAGRGVRGLLVRRYVWCDLWHAELPRLRQESGVPVLQWDAVGEDHPAGDLGRLEAFLEMLR